ncbi:MAG: adenine-specific DNA-methyltransferase [Pseudohongiellaceae bacterium]
MPIKYIGSKRVLLPGILKAIATLQPKGTVLDLFAGTSRVGHGLKRSGYRVLANDHNHYAETVARCYVAADREDWQDQAQQLVDEFNQLPGAAGWFTETYCTASRFFQPHNGERIDAIREAIESKDLPTELRSVLLVALMEAADRVDSTTGLQMAYLKTWAPRSHGELALRVPELLPRAVAGKGEAHRQEAHVAASQLSADLAYIDPPYNQHSYLGNYHIWESLVLWDKPAVYGVAAKRLDCQTRKSPFNSKRLCGEAFRQVIANVQAKSLVVSFNNEGYLPREELEPLLAQVGHVHVVETEHKRYVGAQIGVHSPAGKRVGKAGPSHNKELLYLVTPKPLSLRARKALETPKP